MASHLHPPEGVWESSVVIVLWGSSHPLIFSKGQLPRIRLIPSSPPSCGPHSGCLLPLLTAAPPPPVPTTSI